MRNVQTIMVILLAFLGAAWLRFGTMELAPPYLLALLVCLLLSSIIIPATGAFRHDFRWAFIRKFRRLMAGWALVIMSLVTLAAMLKVTSDYSRLWFGSFVLLGAVALFFSQVLEHGWQLRRRRSSSTLRPVVLAGGGDNGARVERRIEKDPDGELELLARFGDGWAGKEALPVDELAGYVAEHGVSEVWIAAPWDDHGMLESVLEKLKESVVDINVVPDLHQYRMLNQGISEWGGMPVISLSGTPMTGGERTMKAAMDRLAAAGLLVLLSPLFLVAGVLIRLSGPGPVLFSQLRHGMGGEPIEVLKFRSMHQHDESDGQVTQAKPGDQRVTGIGRFLRRTSLDELPQLINVLRGEMSLVGPRPHAVEHNEAYKSQIPKYMLRHKVKPGMTGWAQVHGLRGITDTPEKMAMRIEHDLWYIQNWSFWLDLRIMLMTPMAMVHRNAF